MKEKQLIEILDKHIDIYINNIAFELEENHDQYFDGFGFPLFGEITKQYHEQVYFQSYWESYTRQMINAILKDIFDDEVADEITWPEFEYKGIYRGYTNTECEKEFGFEFINRDTKVGYKYAFFHYDEIDELLAKGNVDEIVLVFWEGKDEIIGFEYGDKRVKVILLWDLFHDLFFELEEEEICSMYDLFIKKVSNAVEQANSLISLTTLPGFTPSYMYKERNETVAILKKDVSMLACFSVNNSDFKHNETTSRQLIDTYKLSIHFLNKKYENAFVGTSDFAKSYLTSEYLYRYFRGNPMFDYTPIVSGYLKSIEQLLHALCKSYIDKNNIQRDLSDYTFGKYITNLKKDKVFRRELVPAKPIIIGCLNSYRAESRNNLFHKDYFNSWNRVEQIRTNTIFLYVVLLGAVDPAIIEEDPKILGVLNIEYDQLFSIIDEQADQNYSFILNGKEYSEMRKERRNKGLVFGDNGLIENTIMFKKHVYDHYESVEISRSNIPSEMWIADIFGNKKRKIWPIE